MNRLDVDLLNARLLLRIKNDIQNGYISGASVMVLQEGKCLADIVDGYANIEQRLPIQHDSLFRLASMTKPIVAVAALIAQEQGLFSIWDPVGKYLPRFREMYVGKSDENGEIVRAQKITDEFKIIHLLTHTAGFAACKIGTMLESTIPLCKRETLLSMVDAYADVMLLDFVPGTATAYSGRGGFDLVAAIIEVTSGLSIAEFINKYITDPLELNDITFTPTEEQWSRVVRMHDFTNGISRTTDYLDHMIFYQTPNTYFCGGAGLVGSIENYATFAQMLLSNGIYKNVRILSEHSVMLMQTPFAPSGNAWGLGVRVISNDPYLPRGSYGWSGAYGCHFWIDPQNEIVAVYMKNSTFDGGSDAMTARHFEEDVYRSFKK